MTMELLISLLYIPFTMSNCYSINIIFSINGNACKLTHQVICGIIPGPPNQSAVGTRVTWPSPLLNVVNKPFPWHRHEKCAILLWFSRLFMELPHLMRYECQKSHLGAVPSHKTGELRFNLKKTVSRMIWPRFEIVFL